MFALQPRPIKLTDNNNCLKKRPGHVTLCQELGNLTASFCDLHFCFGKGDIYLFTMPAVT